VTRENSVNSNMNSFELWLLSPAVVIKNQSDFRKVDIKERSESEDSA